jgi:hypothetical protein
MFWRNMLATASGERNLKNMYEEKKVFSLEGGVGRFL